MEVLQSFKDDEPSILEGSEIRSFFKNSTVFITGASGFLGKLLLEKLLWTCRDVRKIYILLRTKKNKDPKERFTELFDTVVFDRLKRDHPQFINKISYLIGDCCEPNLGLSQNDLAIFQKEIDCIFHCAATVRFDEKLKNAANTNMRAIRDLLRIAKDMKQLRAFVHVSTAYSNCPRKSIDEVFYPMPLTGDQLLNITESLEDGVLENITPSLLGDWPNTYAFTKGLAEDIVKQEGQGLPVAIVRPSIVLATAREPVAGFIDNLYGATGILLGAAMGLTHTLHCDEYNLADMVPADNVVNAIIAAAWDIATIKTINLNREQTDNCPMRETRFEKEIPIYNYVTSPQKPINWHTYMELAIKHCYEVPSPLVIWHYWFNMTPNIYLHKFCILLLHYLPAYIVDFIAKCLGKKPMLVNGYRKIEKFSAVSAYFTTREWHFCNANTQALWKRLEPVDRRLFNFDMDQFDWDTYFHTYVRGCRVYLLKDPLETIPQGHRKVRMLRWAHYTLMTMLSLALFWLVKVVVGCVF